MVFEAHVSRWRMGLIQLASAGFVVLGYWFVTAPAGSLHSRRIPAELVPVLGWACILLFGFCFVVIARRMWRGGLVIRVDEAGILWTMWSDRPIRWDNVAYLEPYTVQGQKMVGIALHDEALDPPAKPKAGRANTAFGFPRISLSATGTDKSFAQLLDALQEGLAAEHRATHTRG